MTTRSTIFLLGFIICLNADCSFSENIVLKSGKTYKNIDVFKQEADRLLITHPGGMATIYLKDCPEDIQRKYNYNTTAADAAVSEREKTVQATHKQIQRDQKIQLEIWKKQQATNEQQKATQQKAAPAQLENKGLVFDQKPFIACFTSSGPQVLNYNRSTMRKIISYPGASGNKKGLIVVDEYGCQRRFESGRKQPV